MNRHEFKEILIRRVSELNGCKAIALATDKEVVP